MKQFEYKLESYYHSPHYDDSEFINIKAEIEAILNREGKNGWELVNCAAERCTHYFYFKRCIN